MNQVARRETLEVAEQIRELLDDEPQWADFGEDTDRLVGLLLSEGVRHHVPAELLWEYAASRWGEIYGASADEPE
jgi:hypothetical protein